MILCSVILFLFLFSFLHICKNEYPRKKKLYEKVIYKILILQKKAKDAFLNQKPNKIFFRKIGLRVVVLLCMQDDCRAKGLGFKSRQDIKPTFVWKRKFMPYPEPVQLNIYPTTIKMPIITAPPYGADQWATVIYHS